MISTRKCSRSRHTAVLGPCLIVLSAFGLHVPHNARGQGPDAKYAQEYFQSFKGRPDNAPTFGLVGPDADQCIRFEPEGLRITLPRDAPADRPNVALSTGLAVQGNFEITLRYELLKEPSPHDTGKRGARLHLLALLDKPGWSRGVISRQVVANGQPSYATGSVLVNEDPGRSPPKWKLIPTRTKTGCLRMVRRGSVMSYYVSEGDNPEFRFLHDFPFSNEDLKDVRIVGEGGGNGDDKGILDARITDLRVRANAVSAGALMEDAAPLAALAPPAPDAPQVLEEQRQSGAGWLVLLGVAAAGLFAASFLCVFLSWRLRVRRGTVAGGSGRALSFACSGCGRQLIVPPELTAKKVKCKKCGAIVQVPV
jgi:hypothetical protein